MAFLTSLFRNLKDGGEVQNLFFKPGRMHQWMIDNPGGIHKQLTRPIAKKDGGSIASIFRNLDPEMLKPMPAPIRKSLPRFQQALPKKKGGKVAKKTRAAKKTKKKSRQKK